MVRRFVITRYHEYRVELLLLQLGDGPLRVFAYEWFRVKQRFFQNRKDFGFPAVAQGNGHISQYASPLGP